MIGKLIAKLTSTDHGQKVAAQHGYERSSHWPSVEKAFKRENPHCLACGPTVKYPSRALQIHHAIIPFHYLKAIGRDDLELDFRNLATLCQDALLAKTKNHHLVLGHGLDFHRYMPNVLDLCRTTYHGKERPVIVADHRWSGFLSLMPKALQEMGKDDLSRLREQVDRLLPICPKLA